MGLKRDKSIIISFMNGDYKLNQRRKK